MEDAEKIWKKDYHKKGQYSKVDQMKRKSNTQIKPKTYDTDKTDLRVHELTDKQQRQERWKNEI